MVLALGAMLSSCDSARIVVKERLADLVEAAEAETASRDEFFSRDLNSDLGRISSSLGCIALDFWGNFPQLYPNQNMID